MVIKGIERRQTERGVLEFWPAGCEFRWGLLAGDFTGEIFKAVVAHNTK